MATYTHFNPDSIYGFDSAATGSILCKGSGNTISFADGGGSGAFWCNFTLTASGNTYVVTCNKTMSQIEDVYNNGESVWGTYVVPVMGMVINAPLVVSMGDTSTMYIVYFWQWFGNRYFLIMGQHSGGTDTWKYTSESLGLTDLDNVNITSVANNDVLKYDSTAGKWVNGQVSGGSSTLSALTDTTITSPTDGQMLKYDNATSKWVNANVPTELPSITNNTGKVLAVNSGATGVEWITNSGGGGLSDYDFDHSDNSSVSVSTTVTFAANTRGSKTITTSGNLSVAFAVNNESDNYLWIKNSGSSEIDIAVTVSWKGTALTSTQIYKPDDGISIPAGMMCEISIVCNNDGAFITSRSDLNIETI